MMLKPSMRENYRYILIRCTPASLKFEGRELYLALSEAVTSLFGDAFSAKVWVAVMSVSGEFSIIRCRRGTEPEVMAAVATVFRIADQDAALHTILVSGTIITLREKIAKISRKIKEETIYIGGSPTHVIIDHSGRIDLKEKGINLQTPQYITEPDIEEYHL